MQSFPNYQWSSCLFSIYHAVKPIYISQSVPVITEKVHGLCPTCRLRHVPLLHTGSHLRRAPTLGGVLRL